MEVFAKAVVGLAEEERVANAGTVADLGAELAESLETAQAMEEREKYALDDMAAAVDSALIGVALSRLRWDAIKPAFGICIEFAIMGSITASVKEKKEDRENNLINWSVVRPHIRKYLSSTHGVCNANGGEQERSKLVSDPVASCVVRAGC